MKTASIEILHEADCLALLREGTLGRVGLRHGTELLVLPVYYAVVDNKIVFRTAPGAKLDAAVLGMNVAFEVDHGSPGWSVLVHGRAEELRSEDDQVKARASLGSDWPPGERERLTAIRIDRITGRRLHFASS
jgi:nitroimidazol reductase NimA-like FMN-containing flavoprotein (pyridoxamine 5'-phosphate oxidase superfamily)